MSFGVKSIFPIGMNQRDESSGWGVRYLTLIQCSAQSRPLSAARITCNPGVRKKIDAQASTREEPPVASNVPGDTEDVPRDKQNCAGDMSTGSEGHFCGTFQ